MTAKRLKGPLMYQQLSNLPLAPDARDTIIRCTNRLSKFNLWAQKELMATKNNGKLFSFQLHNGTFRVKREERSTWKVVDTEAALDPFTTTKGKSAHKKKPSS